MGENCPECGNYIPPGNTFCSCCGYNPQLRDGKEKQPPLPKQPPPVVTTVTLNEEGELPVCPQCKKFKLIWEKLPAPGWALPAFIVGVLTSITCVGVIPLAIGLWGLWMGRPMKPYCPNCKRFFPLPKPS